MARYVVRRIVAALPVVAGIMLLAFLMVQSMPGDPMRMLIPPDLLQGPEGEEFLAARRAQFGLDDPILIQFVRWAGQALQGNLGFSFHLNQPVSQILLDRAGPTLLLMGTSMALALVTAVPVGLFAAMRRNRTFDYTASAVGMSFIAIPGFFTAIAAIYIFAVKLRWLPAGGMSLEGFADAFRHLVLPVGVLSTSLFGIYMRYTRQSALEVLNEPYITAARARGAFNRWVVGKHVLKNAAIPIATVTIVHIPILVGGAIVTETIFAWPGAGRIVFNSITTRDFPVIIGFTLVVALVVVLSQLVLDLVVAWLDPRVRMGET
jgi:ABC-type dipeptide/oligopeptide/nickel transport system permease component